MRNLNQFTSLFCSQWLLYFFLQTHKILLPLYIQLHWLISSQTDKLMLGRMPMAVLFVHHYSNKTWSYFLACHNKNTYTFPTFLSIWINTLAAILMLAFSFELCFKATFDFHSHFYYRTASSTYYSTLKCQINISGSYI